MSHISNKIRKFALSIKIIFFSGASNPAVAAATSAAYANLVEAHNNYVQQLHAANGMVDHYYSTTLPQLLQELDDVYHDVSAVVAETIIQGADVISVKVSHHISLSLVS